MERQARPPPPPSDCSHPAIGVGIRGPAQTLLLTPGPWGPRTGYLKSTSLPVSIQVAPPPPAPCWPLRRARVAARPCPRRSPPAAGRGRRAQAALRGLRLPPPPAAGRGRRAPPRARGSGLWPGRGLWPAAPSAGSVSEMPPGGRGNGFRPRRVCPVRVGEGAGSHFPLGGAGSGAGAPEKPVSSGETRSPRSPPQPPGGPAARPPAGWAARRRPSRAPRPGPAESAAGVGGASLPQPRVFAEDLTRGVCAEALPAGGPPPRAPAPPV